MEVGAPYPLKPVKKDYPGLGEELLAARLEWEQSDWSKSWEDKQRENAE